jgi:threonine dehydrogenase-like Zn-dependent dehydrogenase
MRAAVLHGFGTLTVDDVPDPVPAPGEVIIDVTCVQPSVTECGLVLGEPIALHAHLARSLKAGPVRFGGHEFCGVVSAVGEGAVGVEVGATVTAVETISCGRCAACRRSRSDACVRPEFIGFTRPGAFAERVAVPAAAVVPIPAGVSASAAAAIQPLAGAIHAHALAEVRPGESVLIIGTGVMGLLGVQVARHGGAGRILAAGRSTAKLALAERFGAEIVRGDVAAAVAEATEGIGVDVVFETAGGAPEVGLAGAETLDLAARCVRRGGRIVLVSVLPDDARVPLARLRNRSVSLLHPASGAGGFSPSGGVFGYALRLLARRDVDVEALVSHRLAGLDEVHKALDITRNKAAHGALGPAQLDLTGGWERPWDS